MGREVARVLISVGTAVSVIGLVILGMGLAYVNPSASDQRWGWIIMIGGGAAAVLGAVLYRVTEEPDHSRVADGPRHSNQHR